MEIILGVGTRYQTCHLPPNESLLSSTEPRRPAAQGKYFIGEVIAPFEESALSAS